MDRIKAHRAAPDVYDPPTFGDMAARIEALEAKLAKLSNHRSFPEAGDGRPALPMEAELWAAGCDLETSRFVARQLANDGYTLIRAETLKGQTNE